MTFDELIPAPNTVRSVPEAGDFVLDGATVVDAGPGTEGAARWLRGTLGAATGLPLEAGSGEDGTTIRLRVQPDEAGHLGPEGYRLGVDGNGVTVHGGGAAGVFRGVQTLRQLLGPDAFRRAPVAAGRRWVVPGTFVEDAPRFRWRGLMLDVARHFLPKDDVLRYLDLLAAHKLNVFHFHLTDDQGWRVEIKRSPRLTEVGAWRSRTRWGHRASDRWDENPHGGYYTQDDIREIVAYAAERHISVVPEIDIPGHSQAAIAAYPELGNTDVVDTTALSVWDDWGINPNVLAPTDAVLRFYEGVFEEILDLFPATVSPFVHIGGDECLKDQWKVSPTAQARIEELGLADEDELQSWFIRHFDSWLSARGRRLIGWDEILEGGLADGAAVSSWRGYAAWDRRRPRGARRRHVPRAAGLSRPPPGARRGRAHAHRVRAHPGGRLPLRTRSAGAGRHSRGRARPRHPGQCLDRGDAGPLPRRLPDLPASRRLRRGRLVRAARARRP